MAKIYPIVANQNVRIKSTDGKTKARLTQKMTMVNSQTSGGVQTLFNLTTQEQDNGGRSIMSIFSKNDEIDPKNKSYFVKLEQLGQFLDENGQSLEADEGLKALFNGDGLEISPNSNAISMKKSIDQIVITVNAKDKKPYTIIATPTSISLEYGDGEGKSRYQYTTNNEKCIDITLNRRVVKDMLTSKEGQSVFSTVSSISTLPANVIGQYFSGMKANITVDFNGITLTKLDFGADTPPCCFVKQKNTRGKEIRYFYVEGRMVPCSGQVTFLYENGGDGRDHFTMHIQTATKPEYYYYVPVPIDTSASNMQTISKFTQAYEILTNTSGLNFNAENMGADNGLKQIAIPIDGSDIYVDAKRMDTRKSNPVSFMINDRNLSVQETISPEPYRSGEGEVGIVPDIDEPDGRDRDGDSGSGSSDTDDGSDSSDTDDGSGSGDAEDGSGSGNPNPEHSTGGGNIPPTENEGGEPENDGDEPEDDGDEPEDDGNDGGNGDGDNGSGGNGGGNPSGDDREARKAEQLRKREEHIAAEKARNKEKNKAFKDTMKTVNNIMGETLSTIGIWLMVCSMIPGVGLAALISGAIMASVGLIQTTFADQLVFSPFRRIRHLIDYYEAEEDEEFNARDKFIENERELDTLENASTEKIAALEQMYDRELSQNEFAKNFASLYNTNGVGIASPVGTDISNNIYSLNNIENLDTRLAMAMSLDQISKTSDPENRQQLIENFTANYFSNLNTNQRANIESLFAANGDGTLVHGTDLQQYVSALNELNSAQVKERTLLESQRDAVKSADIYRLKFFASTEQMTEEQRLVFFNRYGTDIIQNAVLSHDGTTEVINQLIENVPEESRDQVVNILESAASQIDTDLKLIDEQAKENNEEHKKVDDIKAYKTAIDEISRNSENVATIDSCVVASENYLKTYSLAYYDGYAKNLEEEINRDLPASATGVEKNILQSVNDAVSMLNPTEATAEMKAVDSSLQNSDYIGRIAGLYTTTTESGASLLGDGGLLANPTENTVEKSHTLYATADTLAKNDLVEFIVSNAGRYVEGAEHDAINPDAIRDELNQKSLSDIVHDYDISVIDNDSVSIKLGEHLSLSVSANSYSSESKTAYSAAVYSVSRDSYQKAKQEKINTALSKITKQVARQTGDNPIVRYNEEKKVYLVANYDINPKKEGKDDFIIYSEDELIKEYTKIFPYFATLSDEQKRDILLIKLGAEGQRNRLKVDRERKLEAKRDFNEAEYQTKLSVYNGAEKFANSLLDGSFSVAYDERAFESVLDPAHSNGRDLSAVENAGQELSSSIEKYNNFVRIINELPISQTEKNNMQVALSVAHINNPELDLKQAFDAQLKPFMERGEVDGEKIYDIIAKYSDVERPYANENDRTKKANEFVKFCDDKNKVIDRRTSTNLTSLRARNGKTFVDREYETRKEIQESGKTEYDTSVDLLAEILYDEEAGASRVSSIKADSKELFKEKLAIKLDSAKSDSDREKLILSLLPDEYKNEYEEAKQYVLDELPTKANIEYFKANREIRIFDSNISKFITGINEILSRETLSPDEPEEQNDLINAIEKTELYLERAGVYGLDLVDVISNKKLSDSEKREQIDKLLEGYEKELILQAARLKDQQEHAEKVREGNSEAERKANRDKDNLARFEKAEEEFDAKFKAIEDYIKEHPDYQYANELVNAFIEGDVSFFEAHPEFRPEGLEFDISDLYLFEKLGINKDIEKLKQKASERSNTSGLTPEAARAASEKASKANKQLLEQLKKQKSKLDKKISAKSLELKIAADSSYHDAVAVSTKTENDIGKVSRSKALNGLSGISKFLSKLKGDRERAAAEEAEARAREEAARAAAAEAGRRAPETEDSEREGE